MGKQGFEKDLGRAIKDLERIEVGKTRIRKGYRCGKMWIWKGVRLGKQRFGKDLGLENKYLERI